MKALKIEFGGTNPFACSKPVITVTGDNTPKVKVSATCATTGATLKYSVNGGETWTNYSHTITYTAAGTKTIVFKAEKNGLFASTDSKTFTVTEEEAEAEE